jgi:hypothetical protein
MSSENKGDHDSLHQGETIESMRQSQQRGDNGRANLILQEELIPRCMRWVSNGRNIRWQDAQDIISQALEKVLDDLFSPKVSPEEASLHLKTALNTARAEHTRRLSAEQSFGDFEAYEAAFQLYEEVDLETLIEHEAEQTHREQHLMKVLDKLRGFMEISLERLSPRDYAILHDIYELGAVGMAKPTESSPLPDLKPGARRVATWRARQRFLGEMDQLLRNARQSLKDEAAVLEGVINLIEGGHLADALAMQQRQQPN